VTPDLLGEDSMVADPGLIWPLALLTALAALGVGAVPPVAILGLVAFGLLALGRI